MIGKELIGKESESVLIKIRSEAVRRFAEATGIALSDQVPPTYVVTLTQASIPGLELPLPGMIHGEQKMTYLRPLYVGDSFSSKRRIKDVYERPGKLGKVTFVVIETSGCDLAGDLVFTSSSTLIAPVEGEGE
ncbi:MAG TPA: MaoC family dehydratase N-terminal domain-containing protein [Desulfosporosinus sp.]|nr:MaoC family dehydratase N-terminal domain-containing protein [Desulfosporosinus sp.]